MNTGRVSPSPDAPRSTPPAPRTHHVRDVAIALFALAALALLIPIATEQATARVGLLLVLAGLLEGYDGFRRTRDVDARDAWQSAAVTLLIGVIVLNATTLVSGVFLLLLGGWFFFDAARHARRGVRAIRDATPLPLRTWLLPCLGNVAIVVFVAVLRERALPVTVAVAAAFRIVGSAWEVLSVPVRVSTDAGDTALVDLGLHEHPGMLELANRIEEEEVARVPFDYEWILGFTATLFALHLGRMGLDRSLLGVLSPAVAVMGDFVIALLVASLVVVPSRMAFRKATRPLERYAWATTLREGSGRVARLTRRSARLWLEARLRFAVRLRLARYSPPTALRRGLRIGLPVSAVIAATVPVWGMSWYFDTENWAAGVWNSWAEARTDTWREAMVRAVTSSRAQEDPASAFAVFPDGTSSGDFGFLVIGDTGEGDASQQVLRTSLLRAAAQPGIAFVVLSSDVVYPTGAMRHYEQNFWLPFMGVRVPVYAIPGNHDWYDALEGFAATFLEPTAARLAMRARVEADQDLSSTTDAHIEALIERASRLGRAYEVPVARQRAPFFQVQTDRFALIAVDTGVARRVDPLQWAWLEGALGAARGKFVMAVLGHPLYAGGAYLAEDSGRRGLAEAGVLADPTGFAAIHALLRRHGVSIVMAGDTHDLEYYLEPSAARTRTPPMHHWVNGGGGAYLSFGTALAWPRQAATATWAHYPARQDVFAKIDASTPWWKRPAWWWTRDLGAWPFSAEWLSALFDSNEAPFFQSFVEVRVEPAARRVRVLPWGVHGRLRWSDLETSPHLRPARAAADDPVEWQVDWPR